MRLLDKIGKDVLQRRFRIKYDSFYLETVVPLISLLNKSRVKYFFTGALAVSYYGRPRTTMDVDVVVDRDEAKLMKLAEILKAEGFDVREYDVKEAIRESGHFSIFGEYGLRIDFKVAKPNEKDEFNRVVAVRLWNKRTYLPKIEDLVVNKLIFGSEQDINDVKGILWRQKDKVDYDYLREQARKKGVLNKLNKLADML